jgi:hypothetical protein
MTIDERRAQILVREFRRRFKKAKKITACFSPDDDGEPVTYAYVWVDKQCYSYVIDEEEAGVGKFEFEALENCDRDFVTFACPHDWR